MSQLERLQKINEMIHERGSVQINDFLDELEISLATFKRDLTFLRDRLNAPITYDRDTNGYRFDKPNLGKKFELPGLWFTEAEATALVTMQHLLSSLGQGGLIGPHIAPLMTKIDTILGNGETSSNELRKRIKLISMGARTNNNDSFATIGNALLKRECLTIKYHAKGSNEITEREVSPQRLIHYRDNWYLDAFCHAKNDLRSFALDGIQDVISLGKKSKEISESELNENFAESYGIFSGKATKTAKLRFTPERARWVSTETWHPKQKSSFDENGYYLLEFEYHQDPELVMDILKYGGEVEVLGPNSLRTKVAQELKKAAERYL